MAGLAKMNNIPGFIEEVEKFQILSGEAASLYGILLPYAEAVTGAMLMLGLWTTFASILIGFMLMSFIIAFGIFSPSGQIINKDIVLLAAAASLLYSGGGAYSIDHFRQTG